MGKARTIRTMKQGKRDLRLVEQDARFYGLADGKICIEGTNKDTVWHGLSSRAGMVDPDYIGYGGARARFLQFFPNDFQSEGFNGMEGNYKRTAARKLSDAAPLEQALHGQGLGGAVLAAYRDTNLLSPFEKVRIADLLRSDQAGTFIQAAAAFTESPDAPTLRKLASTLKLMDCAKWTIITYLPFLWQPEAHMFLKPHVTQDFARRVGHPFADLYSARLEIETYRSLLDLTQRTANEFQDMAPRDNIDIQSLIWVVGGYQEGLAGVHA